MNVFHRHGRIYPVAAYRMGGCHGCQMIPTTTAVRGVAEVVVRAAAVGPFLLVEGAVELEGAVEPGKVEETRGVIVGDGIGGMTLVSGAGAQVGGGIPIRSGRVAAVGVVKVGVGADQQMIVATAPDKGNPIGQCGDAKS